MNISVNTVDGIEAFGQELLRTTVPWSVRSGTMGDTGGDGMGGGNGRGAGTGFSDGTMGVGCQGLDGYINVALPGILQAMAKIWPRLRATTS